MIMMIFHQIGCSIKIDKINSRYCLYLVIIQQDYPQSMTNQQVQCIQCGRMHDTFHVKNSVCSECRFSTLSQNSQCPCGEQRDILYCQYEVSLKLIEDLTKKLALAEEENKKDREMFVREIVTAKTMM